MKLQNTIKKKLIETKEKKENLLIEEKLIKARLMVIFENENNIKNFKFLPKKKQIKIAAEFINELNSISNDELINEQFSETLKSIFGSSLFGGFAQTLFEPMVNSLLAKIGFPEGFFRDSVVSFITSKPSEIIGAFNDCQKLTKLIMESLVEATIMTLQKKGGLTGYPLTMIRNTLGSALKDTSIVKQIEGTIGSNICGVVDKFSSNAKKVANKLNSGNTPKPTQGNNMNGNGYEKKDSSLTNTLSSIGM